MFILFLAIIFGLAVGLLTWSMYNIVTSVPEEDRRYLDQPPLGFRVVWPLIRIMVYYLGPKLSIRYRMTMHTKLRRAGVDFSVSPEQFFAGKLIASVFFLLLTLMMQASLESHSPFLTLLGAVAGFYYPELWLREAIQKRHKDIGKTLPFFLDIITLSVEAGTNLTGAFTQAVQKAPEGALKMEINRILRDVRAGKARSDAMKAMAERVDLTVINTLISSLIQAEKMGSSLGPVLRAQSDQRRTERFQKAEKMAMEAPVKLLGPLIMFIFPNTFIVIGFVLIVKAVLAGVLTWQPLVFALSWPS